jgi:hypothetical protein
LGEDRYEQQMEDFAEAQPVIFSWLFSEQFDLLTEDEQGYLQYLALIIWSCFEKSGTPMEEISEEYLGSVEEYNFSLLESATDSDFLDRIDVFFEDYNQEDLLAFAEEAILEEEEGEEPIVTREGREPIFIALKTLIDVLDKPEN